MAHAHCIQCVILTAFPLQQWLHERASVLRYMYIACLVISIFQNLYKLIGLIKRYSGYSEQYWGFSSIRLFEKSPVSERKENIKGIPALIFDTAGLSETSIRSASFMDFCLSYSFMFFWFFFVIVYMVLCFVYFCLILYVMYSYCYVCSVLYILFSSCQLALFSYPD